jgi:hypothetical protein
LYYHDNITSKGPGCSDIGSWEAWKLGSQEVGEDEGRLSLKKSRKNL